MVAAHGCEGLYRPDRQFRPLYAGWAEALTRAGFLVLFPDSFGPRGHTDLCAAPIGQRPVEAHRERPRDLAGALAYLRTRGDVRADRAALMGWSNEGQAALWAIAQRTAPSGGGADYRAAVTLYPDCREFLAGRADGAAWAPRLPFLVLMGEADNFSPPAPCRDLVGRVEAARPGLAVLHLYPDAHHLFDANLPRTTLTSVRLADGSHPVIGGHPEARADALRRVVDYLRERLRD